MDDAAELMRVNDPPCSSCSALPTPPLYKPKQHTHTSPPLPPGPLYRRILPHSSAQSGPLIYASRVHGKEKSPATVQHLFLSAWSENRRISTYPVFAAPLQPSRNVDESLLIGPMPLYASSCSSRKGYRQVCSNDRLLFLHEIAL
jgi:hypothetical protein